MTVVALGIDVGSTNVKVVMAQVDPVDAPVCLAVATEPTPAEADALVAAVVRLAAQVIARTGLRPEAVGIASMAETGVALDADGRPLTPLLRWDGHRAGAQADALAASLGRAELFAATGVRASAKVPLATWAWLADHEPAVHAEMATWVGVADLLALVLTGRAVTDHTLAGRTMAFRLPGPDGALPTSFDAELLAAVGLRPSTLPQVLGPGEVAGVVPGPSDGPRGHRHWAAACGALRDAGLAAGTPVVVAGHDHAVGTWAGGARTPGDRVDSVGTAEAVLSVLPGAPDPDRTAAAGMSSVITVGGGHAVLAGTSSAGAMLGWLAERTGQDPGVLLAAAHLDLVADPAPTGVLVLPYLAGRQTPAPDPAARVRVLPSGADGVVLARAVLEGVCLQARWMLEEQGRLGAVGLVTGRVVVLGAGVLAVPAWAVTKRRVMAERLEWVGEREPVAVGSAMLAAVRAGLLGDVRHALAAAPALATTTGEVDDSAVDRTATGGARVPDAYDAILEAFVAAATSG